MNFLDNSNNIDVPTAIIFKFVTRKKVKQAFFRLKYGINIGYQIF